MSIANQPDFGYNTWYLHKFVTIVTQANTKKTRPASPAEKLEYAINLAKAGRKLEARDRLRQVVALQPVNQAAWLWLSALATERNEAEAALVQARKINANHPSLARAEQWLAHRFSTQPPTQESVVVDSPPPPPPASPSSAKLIKVFNSANSFVFGMMIAVIVAGLIVLFLGLVFEVNTTVQAQQTDNSAANEAVAVPAEIIEQYAPALDQARANRDWENVVAVLEELHQVAPNSPDIQEQLIQARWQKGLTLRHKGFVEDALAEFEQILTLNPQHIQAQQEIQMAEDYLVGIQHYQTGQWQEAIAALETVQATEADYTNVKDLLFSAYYNHGLALQAANELPQAIEAFEAAIASRPDLNEPYRQIAEIEFALAPQTPLATPTPAPANDRVIVVGIAEQRMHVYEDGEQVFDFVVSTGEPGRDTAIGEFEILDKIDVAYASTWNLDMPNWMGIYWSGPLENGIHALPIVKHTGYKLWDGYLGQRVSYGCIILSDEDAATLFNWTEIGTKVKIVPSLSYWTPSD